MKIVCFGDSNTFGFDPRGPISDRYAEPWPKLLARKGKWEVINEGKNGRNVPLRQFPLAEDADLVIIMLGTNDLLHGRSVETVTQRMAHFLAELHFRKEQILLLSPPPIVAGAWVPNPELITNAARLADAYEALPLHLGISFADPQKWELPMAFDGIHLSEDAHPIFAAKICELLIQR